MVIGRAVQGYTIPLTVEDVKIAQMSLVKYYGAKIPIDGIWGHDTQEAWDIAQKFITSQPYPTENQIEKFLTFNTPESRCINLVLARRISAWLRDNCLRSLSTYGFRSNEVQSKFYAAWIAYSNYRSNPIKYPKAPFANPAAPPGESWHNYHLADDLQGDLVKKLIETTILNYPRAKQPCNKYGICFPMNKHDAPKQLEWWHVVPIETIGYTGARSKFVAPEEAIYTKPPTIIVGDQSIWVSEFMRLTNISFNEQAIKHWQFDNHLVADTIIGPKSWKVAYKLKNVII